MTDPTAALAEALAPWLAQYKAGIIGTFSQGAPHIRWDERSPEDRASWMLGAEDEVQDAAAAILATLPPDWCEHEAKPGRWAFLDSETGDWIEVKPGVVWGIVP